MPGGWKKPEVVVTIAAAAVSALIAGASLWVSIAANDKAGAHNTGEAEALLTATSYGLQQHFKDAGIDDIPALANFFMLLEKDRRAGLIGDSFYDQQISSWCPITHRAYDKLHDSWSDQSFRQIYQGEPWFLERLDKMVGQPNEKGNCL